MKKFGFYWPNLVFGILSVLLGIFLIAGPTDVLTNVIFILVGIVMILSNAEPLYLAVKTQKWPVFVYRLILVIFGIMFIFTHNSALCVIVGLLFIALPIILILYSEDKKNEFFHQLPLLIIGIVILILSPDGALNILYKVLGVVLIAFGLFAIISSAYVQKEIKNE